MTLFTIIQRPK